MKDFFRKIIIDIPVLIFYSILTAVLTYPWIFKFTTHKLGDDIDGSMLVWNVWWVKKALLSYGESIFFTKYIFYPIGTTLVFHTLTIINGIFALIISPVADTLVAFNIITFLTFMLSGYGAFILIEYLTGSRWAALIGGIIYAFSPFRMFRVSFINYLSTQWMPLYFFFVLKILKEKGLKKSNIFWCALFLLFNALSCEIYGFYAILYTIPFLIFFSFKEEGEGFKKNIIKVSAVFILFLIMFSPVIYRMIDFIVSEGSGILSSTLENAENESMDLLAYFIPNPLHPVWGDRSAMMMSRFSGVFQETVIFPGYMTLMIVLLLMIYKWRDKEIIFYFSLFAFSAVMSLGPYLHIGGKASFFESHLRIPMPYILSYYLPFFSAVRIPGRYGVMVMLFISILAGFGIKYICDKIKKRNVVVYPVMAVLVFELWTAPFTFISDMQIPPVYTQIKNESGDFAILHVPLGWRAKGTYHLGYNFTRFQYYQTYHGKRILDGMLARTLQRNTDYFAKTPIISTLVKIEYGEVPDEKSIESDIAYSAEFIKHFNVKYIVLDEVYERVFTHMTPEKLENIDSYLNRIFKLQLVYQNDKSSRPAIKMAFDEYAEFLKGKKPPRDDPFYGDITSLNTTYKVYKIDAR